MVEREEVNMADEVLHVNGQVEYGEGEESPGYLGVEMCSRCGIFRGLP